MTYRRILIAAGRGGSGRSTVAAGLACAFALRGTRVALVDFDLSEPSLDMNLGLEDRAVYHLGDLLSGAAGVRDVAIRHPLLPELYLIPGAYHLRRPPTPEEAERVLSAIRAETGAERIVVDTSQPSDASVRVCAPICDAALVVLTPTPLAVRSAASLGLLLTEWGCGERLMVLNRLSGGQYPDLRAVIDRVGMPLIGLVPEDSGIPAAQAEGIPPCLDRRTSGSAVSFGNMAARLSGEHRPLLWGLSGNRKRLLGI